jgi:FAD/FMN-containing dehydrogenase
LALKKDLGGPLLRKDDGSYAAVARPYNLAYDRPDRMPQGIARCVNADDVATSIKWARDTGIPLRARAGGHSFAGCSTTPGLLIDLSSMRSVRWDVAGKRAIVDGGARNSDLFALLRAHDRMITHGTCPGVGLAGFLLGGGIGFDMRLLGVGSDAVRGTEIVTADGRVRRLPEAPDDTLLWACRGGAGGNFGINTGFTLETAPATRRVTVFNVDWQGRRDDIHAVVRGLMPDLEAAPAGFDSRFDLLAVPPGADRSHRLALVGQHHGPQAEVTRIISRARQVLPPSGSVIREMPYWDAQDRFADDDPPPFRFRQRSGFLDRTLSGDELDLILEHLAKWPGTSEPAKFGADIRFFQTGGRMNQRAPHETAFVHRGSQWLMDIVIAWSATDTAQDVADNIKWQADFFEAMWPHTTRSAYQNFIDLALTDWESAYYATNLGRLRDVKRTVDPDQLFRFEQSIRP